MYGNFLTGNARTLLYFITKKGFNFKNLYPSKILFLKFFAEEDETFL